MKKIVLIILVLLSFEYGNAQTFDEWFKQKKTQKKYLLQQIAAFQIYTRYVQKGYSIASKGFRTISDIKKGDFNLHNDFFGSFTTVNPSVINYAKVADIFNLQVKIVQTYKSTYNQARSFSIFNADELDYIYKIFTNLLIASTADLDQLIQLITENELAMKDDERLKRIDAIYSSIQDKYSFAQRFSEEAKLLAINRTKANYNIQASRKLYGIK